jgi:DNA-binding FrmR family transcriptional regulator
MACCVKLSAALHFSLLFLSAFYLDKVSLDEYIPLRGIEKMTDNVQQKIIIRFRRIEGQIRGLEKLLENDAPRMEVLTQVSAVTQAVKSAGAEVIKLYLEQCLLETACKSDEERSLKMKEFQSALTRYINMA